MADITLGIDGRCFVGPQAGTTRYVRELGMALQTALGARRVFAYGPSVMQLPEGLGWQARAEQQPVWQRLPTTLWYRWRAGQLANQDGVAVFLAGANLLPMFQSSWQSNEAEPAQQAKRAVSVLVVHDLVAELFPQTLTWGHRLAHRLFLTSSIRCCDLLVVNSQGTAQRVQARYGRKPDVVLHPPIASHFQPQDREAIARVRQTYQLPVPYMLAVGTIEPRKNLTALIKACQQLVADGHDPGALVIVGSQGWLAQSTHAAIARAQAHGLSIRLLGHVPDADLPALYAGAQLFVLPSLYEGFGMPVAEALRCGTRVLASDTPETREAGGDQAFYCPPTAEGLSEGLLRALSAPEPSVQRSIHRDCWTHDLAGLVNLLEARV
jgi:glycosyltransferase involved in cell wall biosynthesis